jgi:hypothetical protein
VTTTVTNATPFGSNGPRCKCGADRHPTRSSLCAKGHPLRGTAGPALVVGQGSLTFWCEHEEARCEIREAVLRDAGHTVADAPRALLIAAESIAQATLIRDSAYTRLAEAGGPLAASGRVRRAFRVWESAVDRVERHVRLVGLRSAPRRVPSLDEVMNVEGQ